MASRIDCFSETTSDVFGKHLREQVEERLKFFDTGDAPRKNVDVMRKAMDEAGEGADDGSDASVSKAKDKKAKKKDAKDGKKRRREEEATTPSKKAKKSKKEKK